MKRAMTRQQRRILLTCRGGVAALFYFSVMLGSIALASSITG